MSTKFDQRIKKGEIIMTKRKRITVRIVSLVVAMMLMTTGVVGAGPIRGGGGMEITPLFFSAPNAWPG